MDRALKFTIATISQIKIDYSQEGLLKTLIIISSTFFTNSLNFVQISPLLLKGLLVAMCLDILTGIYKANKLGQEFSWKILKIGVLEKIIYLSVFMGFAYILKSMNFSYEWFILVLFNILVWSETYSFFTNFQSGRTKKVIKEIDFISYLLKAIRTFFKTLIENNLKKIAGKDEEETKKE